MREVILMEDEQIIELYWSRDEEAVVQTRQKYGERLRAVAYGILKSHEDAEESENDTSMTTWLAIPPQRPVYFYAFLTKICRNISFHRLEKTQAKKRSAEIVQLTEEVERCLPDHTAEMRLEAEEIGELLSAFLQDLPKQHRVVICLRSQSETAPAV